MFFSNILKERFSFVFRVQISKIYLNLQTKIAHLHESFYKTIY